MATEDTLTAKENEALIQEMLRDAKKVELPSELTKNPVIHKGDDTLAAPMTVKEISSAGYVYIWETDTFEKVPVLYYMLAQKLRQRRPDGSFRFTTVDPGKQPKRGTILCMLHPDGKDRKHYEELGFRTCPKSNITNQYQLQQHMAKRHKEEWAAIKAEKEAKEKEEDRMLQRLLLKQQLKETETTPEPQIQPEPYVSVKDKPKKK